MLFAGLGCAQQPGQAQTKPGEVSYRVSPEPTEEILAVSTPLGGTPFALQYHLYGDGRLVREITEAAGPTRGKVMAQDEANLTPHDVEKIMKPLAASRLPELTPARLKERTKGQDRSSVATEGVTVQIRFRFERYESPSKSATTPFESTVSIYEPGYFAGVNPDFAEARAVSDIFGRLDTYLPRSLKDALAGKSVAKP